MAPEVFSGHYTEKADVFALGAMFLAIMQRDFAIYNGKKFYGAYLCVPGVGKVGLGYAMATFGFERRNFVQGDPLRSLALGALRYFAAKRPTAGEINSELESLSVN